MSPTPIEQVGADLRERRRRLVAYEQPTREEWDAELAAYDAALAAAAAMLEVPVPAPGPGDEGRPLTYDERQQLEDSLAGAGLDVRTGDL
ncbi:MAG: hypothetical protein M3N11_07870 [Actinomycetota bacterium]|nr:hypothetical protein [Actinomycetota bacterium]